MPIYEYTCQKCDNKFEQLVRTMGGESKFPCPKCGSSKTARTLSVFAVGAESGKAQTSAPPLCGRCGGPPGSCQLD